MMSKRVGLGAVVASAMLLNGCGGGFFIDTKGTTGTSTTGNYIYAANPANNTINEYTISSGALAIITGSPLTATTGLAAASVTVSRVNTYVWVGGAGAISSYTIGSTGALTLAAAQAAAANGNFVSLDTSPDGKWLLGLDSRYSMVYVFAINTSTGSLTLNQSFPFTVPGIGSGTNAGRNIRVSPNGAYVALSLGIAGDVAYGFNTTTGLLTPLGTIVTPSGNTDNAVQFDGTSAYLYVARVGASSGLSSIVTYSVASGLPLLTTTATGNAPGGLLLDYNNVYLYSANAGASTISGFTVGTVSSNTNSNAGTLTPLAVSSFSGGPAASQLVEDKTHAYVVATGASGGADVTLFKFDAITVGNLDAIGTASSGTAGISAVAATH